MEVGLTLVVMVVILIYLAILKVIIVSSCCSSNCKRPHSCCHLEDNFGSCWIFPIFSMGWDIPPKFPLRLGKSRPPPYTGSLGPPKSIAQPVFWLVGSAIYRAYSYVQQPHRLQNIGNSRPHLCTAMRPTNVGDFGRTVTFLLRHWDKRVLYCGAVCSGEWRWRDKCPPWWCDSPADVWHLPRLHHCSLPWPKSPPLTFVESPQSAVHAPAASH